MKQVENRNQPLIIGSIKNYSPGLFGMTKPFSVDAQAQAKGGDPTKKPRRTPGPFTEDEEGALPGDVILEPGTRVYKGGSVPTIIRKAEKFPHSIDPGEVGTGENDPGAPVSGRKKPD